MGVTLEQLTIGISSVEAAHDHGLNPDLDGRPVGILLWTDDVDRDYARPTSEGAPSLGPPHAFHANDNEPHSAWVADPDGNPINIGQRRKRDSESRA